MKWYYLSFSDGTKPKGKRWLGGCFLKSSDETQAIKDAWGAGINPGGEVFIFECPEGHEHELPAVEHRWKLIATPEELERICGPVRKATYGEDGA